MKSTLLTVSAVEKLKHELDDLILIKRKNISEELKVARGYGDLSENAEYHAAREAQAKNESDINKIKDILDNYELLEESDDHTKVSMGIPLEIEYLDTHETETIVIVPSVESDPFDSKISSESPIGSALLGHTPNETIPIATPQGILNIKIINIQ